MHEFLFEFDLVIPMAQSNTSRKSVGIVHGRREGTQIRVHETGDPKLADSPATCSPREAMNYVAEMVESLADLAGGADNREIVALAAELRREPTIATAGRSSSSSRPFA